MDGFAAVKEMISLLSGMVVSLSIGYAVDAYSARGDVKGGFLFVAIMMLLMNAGDLVCLLLMKNPSYNDTRDREKPSLLSTLRLIFSTAGRFFLRFVHAPHEEIRRRFF